MHHQQTQSDQHQLLSKAFKLLGLFRTNLLDILSSNLKLEYLMKKTSNKDDKKYTENQQERARAKWERLTHYMLNIDNIQHRQESSGQLDYSDMSLDQVHKKYGLSQSLVKLLLQAGFIMENPEYRGYVNHGSQTMVILNQQIQQSNVPKYTLTNDGFHYVLLDTPTQVHIVLRKFIEQSDPSTTVDLIKLIFNLTLSKFNQVYKLRHKTEEITRIVQENFE